MPLDPISWALIIAGAFGAGVAFGYFWDDITAWASRMLNRILNAINRAVEVVSNALVYLVKRGTRIYKRVEVFVRNVFNNRNYIRNQEEEIYRDDIPQEILADLDRKQKVRLMEQKT